MPRRKISIEEAFKVLEDAGIPLQVKQPVDTGVSQPVEPVPSAKVKRDFSAPYGTTQHHINPKLIKVVLYAKHSVGSGGFLTVGPEGKQIESAGVQSYGPGVCTVPTELAAHLLHADTAARQADERMLDTEQRSYLIVQRVSSDGQRANVGVQVDNSVLDPSEMVNLPLGYMHQLR